MKQLFNSSAHFLIGFGLGYLSGVHPILALTGTLVFLGYQLIELLSISDTGYHEVKEFGIGFAAGRALYEAKQRSAA